MTPDANKGYCEPVSPLSDQTKPRYLSGTHGATMTEEKLNLTVGLKLRDALEALGAEIVMTREVSEITLSNTERCRIANESGADVHVHIHADGSENKSAHVGIDTVALNGQHFTTHVSGGDKIRKGQLLLEFDMKEIAKTHPLVTPMLVTNPEDYTSLEALSGMEAGQNTTIIKVQ